MVAFRYDDPNRPFVLGSLFHGKSGTGGGSSKMCIRDRTNVTPSEFITKIESVTKLMYDHTNINQSLQTAGALVTLLSNMFHKMSELE